MKELLSFLAAFDKMTQGLQVSCSPFSLSIKFDLGNESSSVLCGFTVPVCLFPQSDSTKCRSKEHGNEDIFCRIATCVKSMEFFVQAV